MKAFLIAVVGSDNFGDEAMFKVAYRQLVSKGYNITVGTYNIERASERFPDVSFLKLPKLSKIDTYRCLFGGHVKTIDISKYDALYVAGGGNLNSIYFNHVCLLWSLVVRFKKLGKYVEFRPQSVGPFYGRKAKHVQRMVDEIVRRADKFYVRELISYNYLSQRGLKVELVRDDAWEIPAADIELPVENFVALSIRPWSNEENLRKYFKKLTDTIIHVGYKILFVPIAYGGKKRYHDNSFLKGFIEGYFLEDIVNIQKLTPEVIKGIIKKCEFAIGMSYHFNVFALSCGKPSAAVYTDEYYRIKNLGLYEAWGSKDAVFKIPETSPEIIVNYLINSVEKSKSNNLG